MYHSFIVQIISLASAHIVLAKALPNSPSIDVRTPPGGSKSAVVRNIKHEIARASLEETCHPWKANTSLDKSWDGAVLLQLGTDSGESDLTVEAGIEVVCTSCYLRGLAKGELSLPCNFNASRTWDNIKEEFKDTVEEIVSAAENYTTDMEHEIRENWNHLDEVEFPTLDLDLDVNISAAMIPESNLRFSFDGLELYMLIDTTLSLGSTYTVTLYNSALETPSPLGISITEDVFLGMVFTVDLILIAQATLDIRTGFHLLLDDGFAIDIALFGDDASGITFNGGQFEFLPVQIESAGATLTAVLRVGAHAGFSLESHNFLPDVDIGGGIEVGVFANIANFTTTVSTPSDDGECDLDVKQGYEIALGANAGATVNFNNHTWGPAPTTTVPIWYTELASACAMKSGDSTTTPATTSPAETANGAERRQEMSTATSTTEVIYTGIKCLSTGLANCPASLQSTSQFTTTSTLTTIVPSGTDENEISWTAKVANVVTTTATFNNHAMRLPATTGSPTSYVPSPPSPTTKGVVDKVEDEVHKAPDRVIIGLSVALGLTALLALIALVEILLRKQRSYKAVPKTEMHYVESSQDDPEVRSITKYGP